MLLQKTTLMKNALYMVRHFLYTRVFFRVFYLLLLQSIELYLDFFELSASYLFLLEFHRK